MKALNPSSSSELARDVYDFSKFIGIAKVNINLSFKNAMDRIEKDKRVEFLDSFLIHSFIPVDSFHASSGFATLQTSTFGFIANGTNVTGQENRSGESLIAIKGTSSLADIATDLKTLPTNFNGHLTHRGFMQTFRSFETHIYRYLDWLHPIIFIWLAIVWVALLFTKGDVG